MSHRISAAAAFAAALTIAAPATAETFDSSAGPLNVERVVSGLQNPWAFAFLPDGAILITEKPGSLKIFRDGAAGPAVRGVPDVVARGQGGLLDVALAPDFADSGVIYLSYSAPDGVFSAQTAVARARLVDEARPRLADLEVIFRQEPSQSGGRHFGSRIVVNDDGSLFVTIGDRAEREEAQNLSRHQGSVVRILPDGSPHPDNPFIGGERGAKPEIYSYGHRNPQGAALDETGALWTVEHGAKGGDEINRPQSGANYGWPTISYGRHYSGGKIGVGVSATGMEQPKHYWDPSIAPSGLAVYEGDLFPEWKGDLLVGALKFRLLARLDVEGGDIVGEERLFEGAYGRIRDVRVGPEGAIWFATDDSDGGIYKVTPAG